MKQSISIFILLFFISSCNDKKNTNTSQDVFIFCDAEEKSGGTFISGEYSLSGGDSQSSEFSKSGSHSLKLDANHPYGFSYSVENVKKGDVIKVSSWKYSTADFGSIVIDAIKDKDRYIRNSHAIKIVGNWELIESYFYAEKNHDLIKIFAYNPEEQPVFFDDISISIYKNTKKPENIENALVINIPQSALDSIGDFRNTALLQGVLTSDLKKYFKSEIIYKGKKIPVKLRLKGDWTDHLKSNKWSFRIKVRGNHSFNGLKSFSIQNPSTRGFMLEWFAHQLYEREDVLTTTYVFIPVIINGVNKGVYALEEHFDKQLLEVRNRREAPIMKFDESGVWQNHLYRVTHSESYNVPSLQAAEILAFKKNRTYKTETLKKQFSVAAQKMNQYRNQEDLLHDCFDDNAIAKYLALTDLINGKHSLIWHNQRFYFNPVLNKLEPIAYDCFTSLSELEYNARLIGAVRLKKRKPSLSEFILNNSSIEEKYYAYLKEFTTEQYMEKALKELEEDIQENVELLKNEYPFADLNTDFFKTNQKELAKQLKAYESDRKNALFYKKISISYDSLPRNVLFTKIALSAYVVKKTALKTELSVNNFHSSPVTIVGYLLKDQDIKNYTPLRKPIKIQAYSKSSRFFKITVDGRPKRLIYIAENCGDSLFSTKISKWPFPLKNGRIDYSFSSDTITFKKGSHTYTSDIIIPSGKTVIFEGGVTMDFKNKAGFISYSPVLMEGTSEAPIHVYSSDSSANGFTIIASHQKVKMSHCYFNGFNTMNKNNWVLTGAVTIYEGKVELNNCKFENNHCEDALNIIRSNFTMNNCTVSNTLSDGFDADFCKGSVKNSFFTNTGNDCMDFSGSTVNISNCIISKSGDKGISGGEKSHLTIKNCSISMASIGIASKDFSTVKVYDVTLNNCTYAFAAYRKKAEFGPAEILVYSIVENNSKNLFLLEKDSKLTYMKEVFIGKKVFNIDSMYLEFR